MNKIFKRIGTAVLATAMGITALGLTSCSKIQEIDLQNPKVSIMVPAFNTYSAKREDSPVVQEIEKVLAEKLGVNSLELDLKWSANTNYGEKVTAAMGSNNWPHIMLITTRTATTIQNSRHGNFWDLTDRLKSRDENGEYKYPNLARTDDVVNHNLSIDGRVYGIYRAREVGRAGVTIRADWVDNLYKKGVLPFGSEHLDDLTIDEFEQILYAFTNNDPDGNGQNDTFGLIVPGADFIDGTIDNIAVWMGAPNGWGLDEDSKLAPDFMSDEYEETIKKLSKWKKDGVINSNVGTFTSTEWNNPFYLGQGGAIIDVADRARRVSPELKKANKNANVTVFGYARKSQDEEPRTLPTTGYSGYFVIPKASVKTEEQLDFVLRLLDHANDPEVSDLMNYGLEGKQTVTQGICDCGCPDCKYKDSVVVEDPNNIACDCCEGCKYASSTAEEGKTIKTGLEQGKHYYVMTNPDGSKSAVKSEDKAILLQYNDLNQFGMALGTSDLGTYYSDPVAKKVTDVYAENKLYKVMNLAEAYVSPTYSRRSTQLDAIMTTATTKFITGEYTIEQWKKERQKWLDQGGQKIIDEMNADYAKDEVAMDETQLKKENHKLQYVEVEKLKIQNAAATDPEAKAVNEAKIERWSKFLKEEEIAEFAADPDVTDLINAED